MVQIGLCFGLIVATMVWCIGHISGGHINPAITVALLITRKISVIRAILFVIAQAVGAIMGAGFLKVRGGWVGVREPLRSLTPLESSSENPTQHTKQHAPNSACL